MGAVAGFAFENRIMQIQVLSLAPGTAHTDSIATFPRGQQELISPGEMAGNKG